MTTGDMASDEKVQKDHDYDLLYELLKNKGYFGDSSVTKEEFGRFIEFKRFFENAKPLPNDKAGEKRLLLLALVSILPKDIDMNDEVPVSDLIEGIPVDDTLMEGISAETLAEPVSPETFAEKIPSGNFLLILGIITAFIAGRYFVYRKFRGKGKTSATSSNSQGSIIKPYLLIAVEKSKLEAFRSLDEGDIAITNKFMEDFLKIPRYLLIEQSEKDIEEIKGNLGQGDFIVLCVKVNYSSMFNFRKDISFITQNKGFNNLVGNSLKVLGPAERSLLREKDFYQAKI
jgi:hypothetical protein